MRSSYGVETAMETDTSIQTNPFLQQKVGQLSLLGFDRSPQATLDPSPEVHQEPGLPTEPQA